MFLLVVVVVGSFFGKEKSYLSDKRGDDEVKKPKVDDEGEWEW
jgi:hypothetical protein